MDHGLLLTDDEIVAVSALAGTPWPVGLATVGNTAETMRAAALRGVRSLTVRGLLAPRAGSTPGLPPDLQQAAAAFLQGDRRVGAYLARMDHPEVMEGAAITAAFHNGRWWIDVSTPDGIHALRPIAGAEARTTVEQFARGIQSGELLKTTPNPSAFGCVIRWGTADDEKAILEFSQDSDLNFLERLFAD